MSETPKIAASTVEGLGRGAYLVTLLPSVVTVLTAFAFFASDLYPWASPVTDKGKPIRPGFDAVLHAAHGLGGLGLTLAGIAALCLSVLLRPFQIAFVHPMGTWASARLASSVPTTAVSSKTVGVSYFPEIFTSRETTTHVFRRYGIGHLLSSG